jgi:molybdate transport system ATP-binding protein
MLLEVDVSLKQGDFVLCAEFEFDGSALGLFGPSGSGKSTLMRALAGLVRPERGLIRLNGDTLFDSLRKVWVPPYRREIGVVFQDARLFPHWSVEKNLRAGMMAEESGIFSFRHIIDLLEIGPLLGRAVANLSGGEQQRIALGRALLAHPRLLLLDEPVTGLDAALKEQILPFLKRVHEELHLPCIMVSHYLPEILHLTDQLVLMKHGQVAAQGALVELVENREAFNSLRLSGLMSTLTLPCGRVGVRPDEVVLATRPIDGLSAQNCIPGTLCRMVNHGETVLCIADTAAGPLMADVTPAAVQKLGLLVGNPVWCIFKTHALHPVD